MAIVGIHEASTRNVQLAETGNLCMLLWILLVEKVLAGIEQKAKSISSDRVLTTL